MCWRRKYRISGGGASCVFCSEPCSARLGVGVLSSRLEEKLRGSSDTLFSPPAVSLKRRIVYLSTGNTGRSSWDDLRRRPKAEKGEVC